MVRIICLAIGYVFGLFQTSYIYGRMNGIDIREHGSGNAGTTNALRTLGKKAGIITLLGDCFKCVFAVLLVRAIFGSSHPDTIRLLGMYAAAGCILGHNFPVNLGFRGGKGIAASVGLVASFDWRVLLIAATVFLVLFFTTHYVSLSSLTGYLAFLGSTLVMGQMGLFHMPQAELRELYVVVALLACLAFYRHRENIVRLIRGTERRTYLNNKSEK